MDISTAKGETGSFTIYQTESDRWAEFECPVCHIDMDYEVADVPPTGSEFSCLGCGQKLVSQGMATWT